MNEKKNLSDSSLKKSFSGSSEIIATTNSKGEIIPKRPDKLNIAMNMNKKLTEEIEFAIKNRENHNSESMETMKLEDDSIKDPFTDDSEKDNTGSPFYADPVDALKEVMELTQHILGYCTKIIDEVTIILFFLIHRLHCPL